MDPASAKPVPAATIILARDAADGIEVLMMRRAAQMDFDGAYVFPGGLVDEADHDAGWHDHEPGLDDAEASRRLGIPSGGLAYWVAGLRECFEEAGLLLCRDAQGRIVRQEDHPETVLELAQLRERMAAGEYAFADFCRERGLRLALEHAVYLSHWITPGGRPRRYDTRFFVAALPEGQIVSHDNNECDEHVWIRPSEALERHAAGKLPMIAPTRKTMELLTRFPNAAAMVDYARSPHPADARTQRHANGRDGMRLLSPGDAAYAEVGKLDPGQRGSASYEIIPGAATRLSPRVRRLTAANPGFMTGPGTNSYLIESGDDIAIVDPGPIIDMHIRALMDEARGTSGKGRIRWLITTHTHSDHSPAASALKDQTGAEIIGMPAPQHGNQDRDFRPDRVPVHGERLQLGDCTLRVIHTPGHASNQVCYLLEEEKLLFTGDHVMQGSTVVIGPPDGDMLAYLDSLRNVQTEAIEWIAPGHGFLIDHPKEAIERIIQHRLQREAKILAALRKLKKATLDELVTQAYDDVPTKVHPVAKRSLHAHMLKLVAEGTATETGGVWAA